MRQRERVYKSAMIRERCERLQRGQMVRVYHRDIIQLVEEPNVGIEQTLAEACGYYSQFWRDRLVLALRRKWSRSIGRSVYDLTVAIPVELIERVDWLLIPGAPDVQPWGDPTTGPVTVPYQAGG